MKKQQETLPISSARFIAFLSIGMSLGLVIILYIFFLSDAFQGSFLIGVTLFMLLMTLFSSLVALKNIRAKLLCPHCQHAFFSNNLQLFSKPKQCQSCQQSAN